MKIDRRFNAGGRYSMNTSPKGTSENSHCSHRGIGQTNPPFHCFSLLSFHPSLRDLSPCLTIPGVETPGYFRTVPAGDG
jgi:hypothetical protein